VWPNFKLIATDSMGRPGGKPSKANVPSAALLSVVMEVVTNGASHVPTSVTTKESGDGFQEAGCGVAPNKTEVKNDVGSVTRFTWPLMLICISFSECSASCARMASLIDVAAAPEYNPIFFHNY